MFSEKGERNGECQTSALHIKTVGPPICQKAYRMPLNKRKMVEEMIEDMLHDEIIRPSNSPYSSPILLVPKRDHESRLCVDYRKLNSVTESDAYPLPLIQDIFDLVGGSAIYSKLDLKAGYYQMSVAEEDIPKTAFTCHAGHYEFKKVPFGLKTAPNFFQKEMKRSWLIVLVNASYCTTCVRQTQRGGAQIEAHQMRFWPTRSKDSGVYT